MVPPQDITRTILSINSFVGGFSEAIGGPSAIDNHLNQTPRPDGWFKVNFNALVNNESIVAADIYRDSNKVVIGIIVDKFDSDNPIAGEALAARLAIKLALQC